ncbi:MAG: diguanylate cyclase [Ramlibacter sp.]|nr:diguanylate cyclase [Ramlibacter sp.]
MSTDPRMDPGAADAARDLALIRSEIEQSQIELAGLREQLIVARYEVDAIHQGRLLEANQRLVLATVAAHRDRDASEQAVIELTTAARLDALTGLPDKAVLKERIVAAISQSRRDGGRLALLSLNLADFKQINGTLGHAAGDQVLRLAARSMAASVRPVDTISRHWGNEFLVLLPGLADPEEAVSLAASITAALGAPTMLGGQVLRLTAHVGISSYPEDGSDADSLIDRAVGAMYRAKWQDLGSGDPVEGEAGGSAHLMKLRTLESMRQPLIDHQFAIAESGRRNVLLQEANTQLLLAAISAQELQAAAEQAQRRQSNFLGVLAHELRNPLAPISSAAAILGTLPTDGPLLSKVQAIIERQVKTMSRLVEDLLDVTRASAGKLRLQMEPLDINALLDDVVLAYRPAMDARLQVFKVQLSPGATRVQGDPVRLAQVLGNLLDNASKYTPRNGQIGLEVEVSGGAVMVAVTDNGIGITPQALATIFEPFMQEPHATLFNGTGLGIGLTVARELVEGHGGRITAASGGKDLGSRFAVTLPLLAVTAAED